MEIVVQDQRTGAENRTFADFDGRTGAQHGPTQAHGRPARGFCGMWRDSSWSNSRLVNDEATAVVRALRQQDGGDIVILASQSIIQALLEADEVDRLSINLAPVIVGAGTRLFQDGMPTSSWVLTDHVPSTSGAVWLYYDRQRSEA